MRVLPRIILFLALAGLLCASPVPLNLVPVTILHQYQQTSNNPCVIGDPSCSNGAFPETVFPSGASSYDALSPLYTVAQIRSTVGNSFMIGVDINQSGAVQTLALFDMVLNGTVVAEFSASPAQSVPPTTGGGNGNGYADYLLTGFPSLAGIPGSQSVQFHVIMPSVNDGREEFFLISLATPESVPEPVTTVLTGAGLLGLAFALRRRGQKTR